MTDLLLNRRETPKGLLVSVCDADILGEEFGNGSISLTVTHEFYDGPVADPQTVIDTLARCDVANLVGTEAVSLAVEQGFVDEADVLDVGETQHAQLLWL